MARTQAADYEQRREAIVDKAAELFASRGFNGASVADLASSCQTSKSLIYHYFPSKEDILFEVMASHIDQLLQDTEEVIATKGTDAEHFSKLIHAFLHHYIGATGRQKVLLNELANLPEASRTIVVSKQRRIIDVMQTLVVALYPELASDPKRARVQTMLIFGMLNWTHTWYDPQGSIDVDELADMMLKTIIR
ncbi:MAG TPA: TetR/AcrR family transcriptional regulator [Novosphingobium sp.]|nr:TetR/AcrR family transcriptional regulator [Novosphingobium sp.]